MRKLLPVIAALGAAFAVTSAQAVVISIDDFNSNAATFFDTTGGDGASTLVQPNRTITHNLFNPAPAPSTCTFSCIQVGAATFPAGLFTVSHQTNADSEVTISWTLAAGFIPLGQPISFFFQIIDSDGNPINADFFFNNVALGAGNFVIPGNTSNSPLNFNVAPADAVTMNGGGVLTVKFNGVPGWDLAIDSFGVNIPEPTSLALTGLALLAAGAAARRRKG